VTTKLGSLKQNWGAVSPRSPRPGPKTATDNNLEIGQTAKQVCQIITSHNRAIHTRRRRR